MDHWNNVGRPYHLAMIEIPAMSVHIGDGFFSGLPCQTNIISRKEVRRWGVGP